MPGHGSHWECLYQKAEDMVNRDLQRLLKETEPFGHATVPGLSGAEGPPRNIVGLMTQNSDVSFMALVQIATAPGEINDLVALYPALSGGVPQRVIVEDLVADEDGLEGCIEGITEFGASISFFDPMFVFNRDRYRIGEAHTFSLAALAYKVEPVDPEWVEVDEGPMVEMALEPIRGHLWLQGQLIDG